MRRARSSWLTVRRSNHCAKSVRAPLRSCLAMRARLSRQPRWRRAYRQHRSRRRRQGFRPSMGSRRQSVRPIARRATRHRRRRRALRVARHSAEHRWRLLDRAGLFRKGGRRTRRGAGSRIQSSPSDLKLACPLRPITRWSWTSILSAFAAATTSAVMATSARDGEGSPLG